jgi:hypothetical protein
VAIETHHKLVKTTPNPSATKNNKGELGPEPPPLLGVEVGEDAAEEVVADILDEMQPLKPIRRGGSQRGLDRIGADANHQGQVARRDQEAG